MSATSQVTQRKGKPESPAGKDRNEKDPVDDKKPDAPVTGTEPPKNKWKSMLTRVLTGMLPFSANSKFILEIMNNLEFIKYYLCSR